MDTQKAAKLREGWQRERKELFRRVQDANTDIVDRIRGVGLNFELDPEEDSVIIYLGQTIRPAITEAFNGDPIYVRLDPETYKIVGFEVLNFSRHLKESPVVQELFDPIIRALSHYGSVGFGPHDPGIKVAASDLWGALSHDPQDSLLQHA